MDRQTDRARTWGGGRPALAWKQRKAEDGLEVAYINDTATQEETGEGWKGRTDRWRVEEEQGASLDWVKWHDIPGMKEKGGRNIPAQRETGAAQATERSHAKVLLCIPEEDVVTADKRAYSPGSRRGRIMFGELFWQAWNRGSDCAWKVLLRGGKRPPRSTGMSLSPRLVIYLKSRSLCYQSNWLPARLCNIKLLLSL